MRSRERLVLMLVVSIMLLAPVVGALAQTGGGYDLSWSTIDGGGYMFSAGGSYAVGGTMGQPDAGTMTGGNYQLNGGFWGFLERFWHVDLPLITR